MKKFRYPPPTLEHRYRHLEAKDEYGEAESFPALFPFQHKNWMGEHHTLKLLKGRVCGDTIVASEGVAALDILLQNEGRLALRQFSDIDRFRTTPTREDGLSCCPQIAHPINYSKHGAHIALPIVLPNRYRDRTRLPAFAPTYREQVHGVIPSSFELDARTQQGRCQNISRAYKQRGLIFFCHCFLPFFSF